MQIIFKNEDKRSDSRRTSVVGALIYARRISGYVEGEYYGRIRIREGGIWVSEGIFHKPEKGIRRRGRRSSKSGKAEKVGAGEKDNGRVCSRIQESSKGKWVWRMATGGRV